MEKNHKKTENNTWVYERTEYCWIYYYTSLILAVLYGTQERGNNNDF